MAKPDSEQGSLPPPPAVHWAELRTSLFFARPSCLLLFGNSRNFLARSSADCSTGHDLWLQVLKHVFHVLLQLRPGQRAAENMTVTLPTSFGLGHSQVRCSR
jgi:hypothetical protein